MYEINYGKVKMRKLILLIIVQFHFLYGVDSFSTIEGLKGTKANLYNGAISEHISTSLYKQNGYTKINVEVGRNGVDGLFVKKKTDGSLDVIFSEVKHGDGKLAGKGSGDNDNSFPVPLNSSINSSHILIYITTYRKIHFI